MIDHDVMVENRGRRSGLRRALEARGRLVPGDALAGLARLPDGEVLVALVVNLQSDLGWTHIARLGWPYPAAAAQLGEGMQIDGLYVISEENLAAVVA